jgi:bifunctional oligoribonuclease and PAP phosphatase NrnA
MPKNSFDAVLAALHDANTLLVTSHLSPDGDAVGSILALSLLLRAMGKTQVACVMHDPVPNAYGWLPGVDAVGTPLAAGDVAPDTVVVLDATRLERLGSVADLIPERARVVVLDHHIDDTPDGNVVLRDPTYSATGEIVCGLYETAGVPMSREAAVCLYVAIATDSGHFRYPATSPRTHRCVAALLERGADAAAISEALCDQMPRTQYELVARVMTNTQFIEDDRAAVMVITEHDMAETGAVDQDLSNIANMARQVAGVEVAMLFREVDAQTTKVSLRSRGTFNSAAFLKQFGGGGHAGAAGATFNTSIDQARFLVLERLKAHYGGAR